MSIVDPVDAFARAAAVFGRAIAGLGDDDWDLPTWPEGWTVVTTVAWVVVGDSQVPIAVAGSRLDPPRDFDAGILGTNPVATWRGTTLAAMAALSSPGALERRAALGDGELVVGDLVGQRVTENLVRGHDVARAADRVAELDGGDVAELADWCLDFWSGHRDAVLAGTAHPAPPVVPPADASPLQRLLALTGRPAVDDP